uniref:Uncharacterized protein n=1 Tax=Graphocephala atropunctata TaxID=36148 RepID=A0A1B6M4J1_9HEMI
MDKIEHIFDSEDLAVFYRSLQLLHSPKIDSQRKMFHLLHQSIRKHHPTCKSGLKNKPLGDSSSGCSMPDVNMPDDCQVEAPATITQTSASQRDPRLHKGLAIPKPSSSLINRDPRFRPSDGTSTENQSQSDNHLTFKIPSNNTTTSTTTSVDSFDSSLQNKYRVAHYSCVRDQPSVSKQLPLRSMPKTTTRLNYCPNPVNLKKIRAVLARGDPFPIHLTKACINNITPDLQREKL